MELRNYIEDNGGLFGTKRRIPIIGIDGLTVKQIKSKIQDGSKFVTFPYLIFFIFLYFKSTSSIYFLDTKKEQINKGLKYLLISVISWIVLLPILILSIYVFWPKENNYIGIIIFGI